MLINSSKLRVGRLYLVLAWEGGGGGSHIWFGRGRACAEASNKPIPIFKGHFGRKWYPLLGTSIQNAPMFKILPYSV